MQDRQHHLQHHRQEGVLLCRHLVGDLLRRHRALQASHNCPATLLRTAINFPILGTWPGSSHGSVKRWRSINRCGPFKTTRSTRWLR